MEGANDVSDGCGRNPFACRFGCRLKTISFRMLVLMLLTVSLGYSQTEEVPPGNDVIVEGIPKIPASLKDAVSRYRSFSSSSCLDGIRSSAR